LVAVKINRGGRIIADNGAGLVAGFGAFAAPRATDERSLDYAYAEVLSGSGGKFTDSAERDAGLRSRGNVGF